MKSIAIIGAGITGLTTAFLLLQKKCPVDVYEAADRAGGVIHSSRQDGFLAEFGPNTLMNTNKKIESLIRDANLTGHVLFPDNRGDARFLVRKGKVIAMPTGIGGLIFTPLFSLKAKINLALEMFRPRWENQYEETIAHFVRRRFGDEFLTYAIDALVAGIYAGNPERLSVIHGFPKLYNAEQKYGSLIKAQYLGAKERKQKGETSKQEAKLFSFDEGLQVLTNTIAEHLNTFLHLKCPVTKISQTENGWKVTYQNDNQLIEREHSAILLSTTAYATRQIQFQNNANLNFAPFENICYAPVTSVVLGYKQSDVGHSLNGFGLLVPGIEHLNILGTLFSSTLFKKRAPQDCVTLSTYVGGMRQPELASLPETKLVDLVHKDLAKLLKIKAQPIFHTSHYYPRAIPQYDVGYGVYKDHIHKIEERCPGFYIGGNYTRTPALSDNILSGFSLADALMEYVHKTGSWEE